MFSLVRSGPTVINIKAKGDTAVLSDAINGLSALKTEPMESYCNSTEGDTLVLLSGSVSEKIATFQTTRPATDIFLQIIRNDLGSVIEDIGITPPNIMMRLLGDLDRAIDQIAEDFRARDAQFRDLMDNFHEQAVLVNFTTAPLNQLVPFDKYYRRALLVDKPYGRLLTYLRAKSREYLTISMGTPDWNEVAITIFDGADQFNLHYQRLVLALQGLDLGIICDENWEPEYTIAFRKSEVYQVRFLTPFTAGDIKEIMLGLEYDEDGCRVVDFDVYDSKKRYSWVGEKKRFDAYTRAEVGIKCRSLLLPRLPAEARVMLKKLDSQINRIT